MIKLEKGQKINLQKANGSHLSNFCIGLNWGMIEEVSSGFFGMGGSKKKVAVDLDASCVVLDGNKNILDIVSFRKLKSTDNAIQHSGDDRAGDDFGDDGLDNEIISIDLDRISQQANQVVFFLNSFKKQDFATIPYAHIRLFEGTPRLVKEVFANYNISAESKFSGYISMVMGKLYKHNNEWKFTAIGEPTRDTSLEETVNTIIRSYS